MTNLVETPDWVAGIYQLETNDPVMGGADSIDNLQATQLAKRTAYLKAQVEAAQGGLTAHEAAADPHPVYLSSAEGDAKVAAAVAALVAASPATLDTLNELASALGNDPNFAATLTAALGGKQPLDATLTALAALATAADKLIYATGADTFATTTLSAFIRTLLDDADAATARATLGAAALAGLASQAFATASLTASGLVDISGVAAGQIKFPATVNPSAGANVLDDYEEGTYYPVDNSSAGLTLGIVFNYIKVGRLVSVSVSGAFPNTADANYVQMSLPFMCSMMGTGVCLHGGTGVCEKFLCNPATPTNVNIYRAGGLTPATNANASNSTFFGHFTYGA